MSGVATLRRFLTYGDEIQALIATDLETLVSGCVRRQPISLLDVGCGTTSMLAMFNATRARQRCRLIGLDAHDPTIQWCRANGFHDEYVLSDARRHAAIPQVDVIVATDLVEHFDKPDALALIAAFERKAALAVILLTPNGFICNPCSADNPFMEHKCGFAVDEFEAMEYACLGLGGPKWMRGVHALPRGPKVLSLPALAVFSRGMRHLPRWSFHILARKTLGAS
jgi:SAM-dependent methyltransferase